MERLADPNRPFPFQMTEQIWVLGSHHFNLFLIQGSRASALVELGVSAVADTVIRQLAELQVKPDYLILTHPHADHITGLPGLKDAFPEAVWVVADGAHDFINHPKAQQAFVDEDPFMHNALRDRGYQPERPPIDRITSVDPCLVVKDGKILNLGSIKIQCIETFGHSPGSLMVSVPEQGSVFVSDALGFHFNGRCILPLYFTGYDLFIETLELIRSLKPSIIGMGHQSPFIGRTAEVALAEACRAAPELHLRILQDPRDDESVIADLFQEYYTDEFTLYSPENIRNCFRLLVKRSRHAG